MLIPRRTVRTSQPQVPVGIDWSNPICRGLATCIDKNWRSLIPTSSIFINTNTFSQKPTRNGLLLSNNGSGFLTVSAGNVAAPAGNNFTLIGLVALNATGQTNKYLSSDLNTSLDKQTSIIYGYVANTVEFYTDNFTGSDPRTGSQLTIADTLPHTFAYSYNGSAWNSFLDGVKVLSATRTFSLSTTPENRYLFGAAPAVAVIDGSIGLWLVYNRALSDAEIKSLSENPWQIFEDEEDYLFVPDASGGGSVSLIVADALHGHAVDSPSFSMATYLAVAESLHTQAADNLTLNTTGSANLAIQEAAHAHVSDGVALTTRWLLIVADALHTHAADNLTTGVTGATTLTVADATSVHTADSVALSVIAFLAIADAVSQHAADNLTLDTSNATFLTVQDAAHAHSSDGTGLSLNTWLAIVEAAHSHTADAPVLSAATALVVAESLHAQFADVVVLSFPSSGSCPTASEIAAAVLAALNATTGTRTVGQHLQIQTAVLAGNETGAGTTHVTFTDGTAVVEADVPLPGAIGNRTNVTISV